MGLGDYFTLLRRIFEAVIVAIYRRIISSPAKSIDREIVLVTGAGHGMGRLQAIEFAKLGATLVVVDINEENNDETADQIRETGGKVYAYTCDLSKRENIKRLGAEVREEVGDVSILVNNAGILNLADIVSIADEKIERLFNVNILAHFWMIREFLPAMKRKNHGHIVAMSSRAGVMGLPFATDYSASKYACVGLCEALSRELRQQKLHGIHVTCVCPSFVDTGFARNVSTRFEANPLLKPELVVDKLVQGVLRNKPYVFVPEMGIVEGLARALLPTRAMELLFDFVDMKYDLVDMKKIY